MITALHGANEIDPDFSLSYALLAVVHTENGNVKAAEDAVERLLRADPLFSARRFMETRPLSDADLASRFSTALQRAGLPS